MSGLRFGKLLVTENHWYDTKQQCETWECICDCGKTSIVLGSSLRKKVKPTRSCGCIRLERAIKANTTHGLSNHPLMSVWGGIMSRCHNKKDAGYKNYGGRGVRMCKEWRLSFKKFYDWCMANGWMEGLQVDKDMKGDGLLYSSKTCTIVTHIQNQQKKRTSFLVKYKGRTKSLTEWCKELGMKYNRTQTRMKRGRSFSYCVNNKDVNLTKFNGGNFRKNKTK